MLHTSRLHTGQNTPKTGLGRFWLRLPSTSACLATSLSPGHLLPLPWPPGSLAAPTRCCCYTSTTMLSHCALSPASGMQGKKIRTVNPVYRKIYRYRLCPRNEFRRNFEFFGFKIQKFKKIHKKRKPDFPTGFRCFPVGKHCFSNVKKYFGIYGIAKELLHMYI